MSIINVQVLDQTLKITNSPRIASGGINEDYVVFNFDSVWDGFGKAAIFYSAKNPEKVYESAIDETGKAVVPHEVTAEEGKIYFGVCGVKNDIVLTSEVLFYEIVKGIYTGGEESEEPTPSVYNQMLSIAGHLEAMYNALEADQAEFEASVETRINNLVIANTTNASGFKIEIETATEAVASGDTSVTHSFEVPLDSVIVEALYLSSVNGWSNDGVAIGEQEDSTNKTITLTVELEEGHFVGNHYLKLVYAYPEAVNLAELTDIRLGADGTVYESAGAAVRTQIAKKFELPVNGEAGQVLVSNGNGGASWVTLEDTSELPDGDGVNY